MATKIVTKNSSTASAVPTASDLVQGELAVNVADKKLFTEDNSGAIIELADGVKLAGIEASADVTDTANVTAAGAVMDSELTSEASVKALNQGVATTDSPAFAGLTVDTTTLAVDSTNNRVGIGTSSPSTKLEIRNDVNATTDLDPTAIKLYNNNDGGSAIEFLNGVAAKSKISFGVTSTGAGTDDSYLGFSTGANAALNERMRIDSSGKVGIGTSSPANTLDVLGDVYSGAFYRDVDVTSVGPAASFIQVGARSGSTRTPAAAFGSVLSNPATTGSAVIQTLSGGSLTERMRIDSSGNVGIGTTTVGQFDSTNVGLTVDSGNAYSGIAMTDGSTTSTLAQGFSTTYLYNQANGSMLFGTNNTERMRIDSSGQVGINTSAPEATLHIADVGTTGPALHISGGSSTEGDITTPHNESLQIGHWNESSNAFTERMRIDTSGNLLVGQTAQNYNVAGTSLGSDGILRACVENSTVAAFNRRASDGTIVGFYKNGVIMGSISTNANSLPSDRNFKRNIQDLTLGLDFVESLNPVTYNFKIDDEGQAVMTGLIAQEVEEALTAAGVEKNSMTLLQHTPTDDVKESDYQMDYLKFVPILINSIKEQQTLIESLTARIAALEE